VESSAIDKVSFVREMKFLVIFGAVVVLCLAQSSYRHPYYDYWGYEFVTPKPKKKTIVLLDDLIEVLNKKRDTTTREIESLKVEISKKDQLIDQQLKIIAATPEDKMKKIADNLTKLNDIVQTNEKNEKELKECKANLATNVSENQQLEATSEDLKKQLKAKKAKIEANGSSIGIYTKQIMNFLEKANKIIGIVPYPVMCV
jgi:chromosome segregation ATPase